MRMSERIESLHKILAGEANKYADLYIKFLRLKEQNAELLEALREVILSLPDPVYSSLDDAGKLDRAHEAIAKATDGE